MTGYPRGVEEGAKQPERFAELIGELDYPMLVVTTAAGEERAGCLVGFATQASIDPPCFLVCLSKSNRTCEVAINASGLVVHLLPAWSDDLAELFGGETGDETDKFARCEWEPGPDGIPILAGCPAWFAAEIDSLLDVGDHVAFLLAPFEWRRERGIEAFRTSQAEAIEPGHEP
jgi:flavin reductase (DIM6/NTAB) family NADH-FMN oxidoreductase RutF